MASRPLVVVGGATDTTRQESCEGSTCGEFAAAIAASMASGIPFRLESGPVITKSAFPSLFKSMPSCAMGLPPTVVGSMTRTTGAEVLLEVAPPAAGDGAGDAEGAEKRC